MTDVMIKQAIASSIVGITRHVMSSFGVSEDEAYRRVYGSTLHQLLVKPDTRLYLEPNEQLSALFDIEQQKGIAALTEAII